MRSKPRERNGRTADLQRELEARFLSRNQSPNRNTTSIPATFLRVTVAIKDGVRQTNRRNGEHPAKPPPHAQLIEMATAHWILRIVYVAAKLDLADRLDGEPKSADELAGPTGTHAPSLYRLMRTLAHLGILSEDGGQRFTLTTLGEALKKSAPASARATILTLASDRCADGFGEFLYSVQTGKSGVEAAPA